MFWRDLKLTAYMVLYKLTEEGFILIQHKIVKAHTATYKHLFYTRQLAHGAQNRQIVLVVNDKVFASLCADTFLIGAHTEFFLLKTRRVAEVCGRAAYVVDIAFKVRV